MKTCLFCDQEIGYRMTTCKKHLPWIAFSGEVWFRELVYLDSRQTRINVRECHELTDATVRSVVDTKPRAFDKNLIRDLKKTMTIAQIATLLGTSQSTIKSALYRKSRRKKPLPGNEQVRT